MEIDDALTSLYDAYNGHSPSQVAALYRTDGRHVEVAQGNERSGRDAIREGLARFFEAFPDAHWAERVRIVAADCHICPPDGRSGRNLTCNHLTGAGESYLCSSPNADRSEACAAASVAPTVPLRIIRASAICSYPRSAK